MVTVHGKTPHHTINHFLVIYLFNQQSRHEWWISPRLVHAVHCTRRTWHAEKHSILPQRIHVIMVHATVQDHRLHCSVSCITQSVRPWLLLMFWSAGGDAAPGVCNINVFKIPKLSWWFQCEAIFDGVQVYVVDISRRFYSGGRQRVNLFPSILPSLCSPDVTSQSCH
jgi:hypothetical protein